MSWTLLVGAALALGATFLVAALRRVELDRMRRSVSRRDAALREGRAEAELSHPVVDLTRCLGCGTCVLACPEENVLDLVHGQAKVIDGARCKGISACARECPVGAIRVELTGLETRRDVPVLSDELEAVGAPGVFLAGEVTAHALIQRAVEHGTRVAHTVAERRPRARSTDPEAPLDLVIVGAGPAGMACALEAKRRGLRFQLIEQEAGPGGTVAKYPRRKLVLMQPVHLPLHGTLDKLQYTKEEIVELWRGLMDEHRIPVLGGQRFEELVRLSEASSAESLYAVRTDRAELRAHNVCLALGRRGTPRKLGVPGEQLEKVTYSLLDARSFEGRRVLVVGGGDSALEAARGLAEQSGAAVTLVHRGAAFTRASSDNERRLLEAEAQGRLRVLRHTELESVAADEVQLIQRGEGTATEGQTRLSLPNDDVLVMIGGIPPFELLERSGVSLDPELRRATADLAREAEGPGRGSAWLQGDQGAAFVRTVGISFGLALVALLFSLWNADYYLLPNAEKPLHPKHLWLRPGRGIGLALGVLATVMVVLNLLYVARRSPLIRFQMGSMQVWMTAHVATGVLALLGALLHGAMAPGDTAGGHAFWAIALLVATGAVGRYFYAYVPRAANGRELELEEVKEELRAAEAAVVSGDRRFLAEARHAVLQLVEARQWRSHLPGRVLALLGVRYDLHRTVSALTRRGRERGVSSEEIAQTMELVRRAHRAALMSAHYEDLRALLSTWRYVHRWGALLLVLLLIGHVVQALSYGMFQGGAAS